MNISKNSYQCVWYLSGHAMPTEGITCVPGEKYSHGDQRMWLADQNAKIENAAFVSRAIGDRISRFVDRSRHSQGVSFD